jgi:hypothetical protein
MQFKPDLAAMIIRGEKWETRRLKHPMDAPYMRLELTVKELAVSSHLPTRASDVTTAKTIQAVYRDGRLKWQVGRTYTAQPGRGKLAIAYFPLEQIRLEKVRDISQASARAEGFASIQAFFDRWAQINGADTLDHFTWVLAWDPKKVTTPPF